MSPPARHAGSSCAQGPVFADALAYYAERVPGGVAAIASHLTVTDADARSYCGVRFAASEWYPLPPLVAINRSAAALSGVSAATLAGDAARWAAERKMRGVYRLALRLARPEWLAPRLPQAALRFFDFGRAEVNRLGRQHFEAWQRDIPAAVGEWFGACVLAVAPLVLERCGARSVA